MKTLSWRISVLCASLAFLGAGCGDRRGAPDAGFDLDGSLQADSGLEDDAAIQPDAGLPDAEVDAGSEAVCGDSIVDSPESCDTAIAAGSDEACPISCEEDTDPCTTVMLMGTGCMARCEPTETATCGSVDRCCPSGCTAEADLDCGRCTPGGWSIEEISGADSYEGSGIGIDSAGAVYVAAGERGGPVHHLETRSRAPGETAWTEATLATGPDIGDFDFHVTPEGDRFASYCRTGPADAYLSRRLATGEAGSELVSSDWDAGRSSAVAVDPSGDAHVIFHQWVASSTTGQPLYRRRSADGSWAPAGYDAVISPFSIGEIRGENISAVADATRLHIAYWDREDGGLFYAWRFHSTSIGTAGAWTVSRIGSGGSLATDIALDGSGGVHIVASAGSIWAYFHSGSGWVRETPDMAGGFASSIAVDAWGEVHVGYGRDADGTLYGRRDSSGWSLSTVDSTGLGEVSVAVDGSGAAHLGYFRPASIGSRRVVTYATGCP